MFESSNSQQWERQTLQKVLLEHIREQRLARRWRIFFKVMMVVFLGALYFNFSNKGSQQSTIIKQAHTALIDIHGAIDRTQEANAEDIRSALRQAFENKSVKGIILRINSPGGSPVQARQIFDEIQYLKKQSPQIKVYATIEESGLSAAYLIAAAADAIYSDKTSLVGSIGVIFDSFGFVEAMQKFGVERRLYTAGAHKGMLDQFSPRNADEDAFIVQQMRVVHTAFIENVRAGRGPRLQETPDIFSGLFWSGQEALELGLIDGFGDARFVARDIIKEEEIIDYTPSMSMLEKLAHRIGASVAKQMLSFMKGESVRVH